MKTSTLITAILLLLFLSAESLASSPYMRLKMLQSNGITLEILSKEEEPVAESLPCILPDTLPTQVSHERTFNISDFIKPEKEVAEWEIEVLLMLHKLIGEEREMH